jgi:hypothetical protein
MANQGAGCGVRSLREYARDTQALTRTDRGISPISASRTGSMAGQAIEQDVLCPTSYTAPRTLHLAREFPVAPL